MRGYLCRDLKILKLAFCELQEMEDLELSLMEAMEEVERLITVRYERMRPDNDEF